MNRVIPRAEIEKFTAALAEKRRRLAKAEHSTRGYRDEDGIWRGGLLSFVRYFWHVLEPGTPFVDGWVLEAICEHLEAVTFGEITNLLINVPPGFSKSLITNCFWPAWEWGAMELSHIRYVTFSYSSSNTERDNQRFGDLIISPDYQAMYPHVKIRQKGFEMVSNLNHGWKLASSVSGSVTGKRGNRAICFPADQLVQTEFGQIPIGDIVEQRLNLRVWSYNRTVGTMELKPIEAWHRNPGRRLVRITLEDGHSVTCTEDHPILSGEGYRKASHLRVGQFLFCKHLGSRGQPKVTPCSAVADVIDCGSQYAEFFGQRVGAFVRAAHDTSDAFLGKFCQSIFMARAVSPASAIGLFQWEIEVAPDPAGSYAANSPRAYPKFDSKVFGQTSGISDDLANHFLGEMRCPISKCAVTLAVVNILRSRSVLNVIKPWISSVAVFVTDFLALGIRPNECFSNQRVSVPVEGFTVTPEGDAGVSFDNGPCHDFAGDGHLVAASDGGSGQAFNTPEVGDLVGVETDHSAPYLACITSVEYLHDIPSVTYCLTVQGNHNLVCGSGASVICSNCDDLNNVSEAESKAVLEGTNRWFRESLSSRLNNMETDAKVVIAQRVGEGDVSGEILRLGLPYCHLMIQMEYVWQADNDNNPYTTSIGWIDPRWRPNAEDCEGALAWEERFPEKVVVALKVELGPFATAAQLQQTPEPRGGGLIKREWWMPADPYMTGDGQNFPPFSYVVASLDGAYTAEEQNDPSALTIWGIFTNEHGYNRAMLAHAWEKRLEFSGPKMDILPSEHESVYRRRCMPHWGLVEWVADTCNRFKVDRLLVENKASGKSAAQSLRNSHGRAGWSIELIEPKGDKLARGMAVVPSFSQEMIYAPDRDWAQKTIDQMAIFPYGKHDDLYDSGIQAIKHLRDSGLLRSDEDRRAEELDAVRHKGAPKQALYPGFRRRQA